MTPFTQDQLDAVDHARAILAEHFDEVVIIGEKSPSPDASTHAIPFIHYSSTLSQEPDYLCCLLEDLVHIIESNQS